MAAALQVPHIQATPQEKQVKMGTQKEQEISDGKMQRLGHIKYAVDSGVRESAGL